MYEPLRLATQPLSFLLVALVVATGLACRPGAAARWRRLAFALALLLAVACHPLSAWWLAHRLEVQYSPPVLGHEPRASTLVVLSGGILAGPDGRGELAEDSLVRTVCAAQLAQRTSPDLIVVSGGAVNAATPVSVAARMRDLLVAFGVPATRILVEPRATTTIGNARESWRLLAPRGVRRIGLVTDRLHMPRSVGIFRAAGFDVLPLPCQTQTGAAFRWSPSTIVPGPRAAWLFNRAAHEWTSLVYFRLTGAWQ